MSERGVFAVDRGIFDHPLLEEGLPFSRREAWLWLLSEAEWQPRKRSRSGLVIALGRGQLAHSVRFMADAWRWHAAKVQRFLAALKTDTMIDTQADTGMTVITICKYNEYQRVSLPERYANEQPPDTATIQPRYKLEDREYKEDTTLQTGAGDHAGLLKQIADAGGLAIADTALILIEPLRWLQGGCDLKADVLPVIQAKARGQPKDRFKNLSYFSAAIFEARDRRLSPAPIKAARHAEQPRKSPHDRIGAFLDIGTRSGDNEDRGGHTDPGAGPIIDCLAERLPHHPSQGAEIIALPAARR